MKRTYNVEDTEPEQSNFKIPSEKEHLFQVTDWHDSSNALGNMTINDNTICAKVEVVGGDEEGLGILIFLVLDQNEKRFYFTRLFLKAIGEGYKGDFDIDPDRWIGRQFYATVKHSKSKDGNKTYANIDQYNFDKVIEQYKAPVGQVTDPKDMNIAWED